MARSVYRPPHVRRVLGALALLLGFAGSAAARSAVTSRLAGPRASVVWTQRAAGDDAIWWGTAGGLLGALIGAASARNEE